MDKCFVGGLGQRCNVCVGGGGMHSGGQTPWLIGRPADIDRISNQWSKFRKIAIFRKNFQKDLNQNIDQISDICSKSSKIEIFREKKKKDLYF